MTVYLIGNAAIAGPPGAPTSKFWGDGQLPGATGDFYLHRYVVGGQPDASELISEVELLTGGTITIARFTCGSVANTKTATLRINGVDVLVSNGYAANIQIALGSGVTSGELTALSQAVSAGAILSVKYS